MNGSRRRPPCSWARRVPEVVVMNSLTINLHLLMASFYRPTRERHVILIEHGAFPVGPLCRRLAARLARP